MRRLPIALTLALVCLGLAYAALRAPTWWLVHALQDTLYAQVAPISTQQLADTLLAQAQLPAGERLQLLDLRNAEEYALSRIAPAQNVSLQQLAAYVHNHSDSAAKSRLIVVYCSVGLRSAQAAHQLQQAGFTQVRNLRGGIFQWAEQGRLLEGARQVHPYNSYWGQMLPLALRAQL